MKTENTTTKRIREARESIASARSAMETADAGLSRIQTIVDKAGTARRHPMATMTLLALIGAVVAMLVMGSRED